MGRIKFISRENLNEIPKTSGVYSFLAKKSILYIGKAADLRSRVKNHFLQPSYRDDLFVSQISKIGYIETPSEIDALLLEAELIKKYRPKYNVTWKDNKNYFFVAIAKKPIPYVFLTHQPSDSPKKTKTKNLKLEIRNFHYVGPFTDGKSIKRALSLLRQAFPYYTVSKHPAKLCQWCHLGLCPGPNPNIAEYKTNIKKLVLVLRGKRFSVLRAVKKEMLSASRQKNFELAAKLRDQLLALENVISHNDTLKRTLRSIFKTKTEISRIEAYDVSNIQGKEATGSMVTFIEEKPSKNWYRKFKIKVSGKPNDTAMIKEILTRRLAHKEWPYPDLIIIDGGKPQLSAALQALQGFQLSSIKQRTNFQPNFKYQISNIKIAALAKKYNELFLPNKKTPILLKNLPQSAQNLILRIRDEAHRFAIKYHRKLREKEFFAN